MGHGSFILKVDGFGGGLFRHFGSCCGPACAAGYGRILCGRCFGPGKLIEEIFVKVLVEIGLALFVSALADGALHAVEGGNEGAEGIGILIESFILFAVHFIHELVHHLFIEILVEILIHGRRRGLGLGHKCAAGLLFHDFRLRADGLLRHGLVCLLLHGCGLLGCTAAGLILLVPAAQLVIVQFRAVVAIIVHSVTASHGSQAIPGVIHPSMQ